MEHYESIGVTGLTVLGVFGEAAALSAAERRQVLEAPSPTPDLPLVVGVTSLGTGTADRGNPRGAGRGRRAPRRRDGAGQLRRSPTWWSRTCAPCTRPPAPSRRAGLSGGQRRQRSRPTCSSPWWPTCRFVAAVKAEAPPTPPAIAVLTSRLDVPVFGGLGGIGLLDELVAGAAGAMTGFSFPEGLHACVPAFRSRTATRPPARRSCRTCR